MYYDRTLGPTTNLLTTGLPLHHAPAEARIFDEAVLHQWGARLEGTAPSAPYLIAHSYSLYSQHQLSGALSDSWTVCEQLLTKMWRDYAAGLPEPGRSTRLKDTRTYTSSVQTEQLYTAGAISEELYLSLHVARRFRNNLVHDGEVTLEGATAGMHSLRLMLERELDAQIAEPIVTRGVSW